MKNETRYKLSIAFLFLCSLIMTLCAASAISLVYRLPWLAGLWIVFVSLSLGAFCALAIKQAINDK